MLECSECGARFNDDEEMPIGGVFCSESDGFKKDRFFCSRKHFEEFYKQHPAEHWKFKRSKNKTSQYETLKEIFDEALHQAQFGKGKQRHDTDNKIFEDQHMCSIQRLLKNHPTGGLAFQSIKKIVESGVLYNQNNKEQAKNEILGSIVYAAGMLVILNEEE